MKPTTRFERTMTDNFSLFRDTEAPVYLCATNNGILFLAALVEAEDITPDGKCKYNGLDQYTAHIYVAGFRGEARHYGIPGYNFVYHDKEFYYERLEPQFTPGQSTLYKATKKGCLLEPWIHSQKHIGGFFRDLWVDYVRSCYRRGIHHTRAAAPLLRGLSPDTVKGYTDLAAEYEPALAWQHDALTKLLDGIPASAE